MYLKLLYKFYLRAVEQYLFIGFGPPSINFDQCQQTISYSLPKGTDECEERSWTGVADQQKTCANGDGLAPSGSCARRIRTKGKKASPLRRHALASLQLILRSTPALARWKRVGAYGEMSMARGVPVINCETILPLGGPPVMPKCPWPSAR